MVPLAPLFLLAGFAAAIPVALHLMHRRKPKPLPFGTIRFLQEAVARTRRSRHLTNVFVLLFRVLIILLLAAAFAKPVSRMVNFLPAGKRTVCIYLDAGVEMRCTGVTGSLMENAVTQIEELIHDLDDSDQVAIFAPDALEPVALFPPVTAHNEALARLKKLECGYSSTNFVKGLDQLLSRLENDKKRESVEIHIFSDFRKNMFSEADLRLINEMLKKFDGKVFFNIINSENTVNAGVKSATFYPPAVLGELPVRIRTDLVTQNFNAKILPVNLSVYNEPQEQANVQLAGNLTGRYEFTFRPDPEKKYVVGQVSLDSDSFIPDNDFFFTLPKVESIPVLLVDGSSTDAGQGRDVFFLHHAIVPMGQGGAVFNPVEIEWPRFLAGEGGSSPAVFICNPRNINEGLVKRIERIAEEGSDVLIFPGNLNSLELSLKLFNGMSKIKVEELQFSEDNSQQLVYSNDLTDLEKRLERILGRPNKLTIRRRLKFSNLPPDAEKIMVYPDGTPLLFRIPVGKGKIWFSSISANRDWADWPLLPSYVIAVQEIVRNATNRKMDKVNIQVGGVAAMQWPELVDRNSKFTVIDSTGKEQQAVVRVAGNNQVLVSGLQKPGYYVIEHNSQKRLVAVNIKLKESKLERLARQQLLTLMNNQVVCSESSNELSTLVLEMRRGRPVWPLLLICAFLLVVFEELFSNIRSRKGKMPVNLNHMLKKNRG